MPLAIETNGLTRHYGSLVAVDSLDLAFEPAQLLAQFGLADGAESPFATLSRALKHRLTIAAALPFGCECLRHHPLCHVPCPAEPPSGRPAVIPYGP